jgi:hypothetical protein
LLCRSLLIPILALLFSLVPSRAQDDGLPDPTPWQEVISSQIQAFREHDAPGAFMYAGASFHVHFPNAETFFAAIMGSGYTPIMDSTTHSFGEYRMMGSTGVVQLVRLIGKDQQLYGAFYQLAEEKDGWRVQAVQLFREPGVAI